MDRGYVLLFEPSHPNARKDGYVAEHIKVMLVDAAVRVLKQYRPDLLSPASHDQENATADGN
jgi:flagellar basal body rod protein FlgC